MGGLKKHGIGWCNIHGNYLPKKRGKSGKLRTKAVFDAEGLSDRTVQGGLATHKLKAGKKLNPRGAISSFRGGHPIRIFNEKPDAHGKRAQFNGGWLDFHGIHGDTISEIVKRANILTGHKNLFTIGSEDDGAESGVPLGFLSTEGLVFRKHS